jgi:hypothetical protein
MNLALVQPITLEHLAECINADFDRMERAETRANEVKRTVSTFTTKAMNARVSAGLYLLEAQEALKAEDPHASFAAWCEANVKRSVRDCQRCVKLARTRQQYGCLSVITGAEVAIWERPDTEIQVVSGDNEIVPCRQNRNVQIAFGIYRKMTLEEREAFNILRQELDNA